MLSTEVILCQFTLIIIISMPIFSESELSGATHIYLHMQLLVLS